MGGTCSGRPKRPPRITLAPGSARCRTRPEIRISFAKSAGSGSVGEGDDVLLVPDLPAPDRQVRQLRVLFPERAVGPVAVAPLRAGSGLQAQRCQALRTGRSIACGATHSGEPQTNGMIRIPASAASSTSRSKPAQSGSATVGGSAARPRSSRAAAARCRPPLPASARSPCALAGALRRDPDEARRQVGMRRRRRDRQQRHAARIRSILRVIASTGTGPAAQSSGRAAAEARPRPRRRSGIIAALGAWRSLVARTVRVGEVPGSNPGAPISARNRSARAGYVHCYLALPSNGSLAAVPWRR